MREDPDLAMNYWSACARRSRRPPVAGERGGARAAALVRCRHSGATRVRALRRRRTQWRAGEGRRGGRYPLPAPSTRSAARRHPGQPGESRRGTTSSRAGGPGGPPDCHRRPPPHRRSPLGRMDRWLRGPAYRPAVRLQAVAAGPLRPSRSLRPPAPAAPSAPSLPSLRSPLVGRLLRPVPPDLPAHVRRLLRPVPPDPPEAAQAGSPCTTSSHS